MNILPAVIRAEHVGGFQIRLFFNEGTMGIVDFGDWLEGPIFEPLREQSYFERFFVDGGAIAWPNGADIAPETLYDQVRSLQVA
jgi:hypothetical protein